jgi:hypothetical protein
MRTGALTRINRLVIAGRVSGISWQMFAADACDMALRARDLGET